MRISLSAFLNWGLISELTARDFRLAILNDILKFVSQEEADWREKAGNLEDCKIEELKSLRLEGALQNFYKEIANAKKGCYDLGIVLFSEESRRIYEVVEE